MPRPDQKVKATAIPLDLLEAIQGALLLPSEASPLETIRELWKAFNQLRKEAHKAEGSFGREPGASAGVDPAPFVSPGSHDPDPEQLRLQLDLQNAKLEEKRIELQIVQEKRNLTAQQVTLQDRKRKANYWKAVKSGDAPPPQSWQRPAPSPDSSPLIGKSLLQPSLVQVDKEGNCMSCGKGIGWLPENQALHSKNCSGLAK